MRLAAGAAKLGKHYFPRSRAVPSGHPTCIDIFAGAGGLAEGFRQAGFSILSGVDIDPAAGATFRHNFPEASFFERSVSDLTGLELLADAHLKRGELDCLIGGPPCQSFSYNNHERSRRKAQARLFRDYLRLVTTLRPKYLVMENVPGILTIGGGAIVAEICNSLAKLRYKCEARILFAEDFGVPQERRRVFFVATRLGWDDALFPVGHYGPAPKPSAKTNPFVHQWSPRPGRRRRPPTVWQAVGDLPHLENGGGRDIASYVRVPRSNYQRRMRGKQLRLFNHVAPELSPGLLKRIGHVPEGGNWRDIPFKLLPNGMRRARKKDHTKRYGRLDKGALCCTILTKCDPHWGSYVHPVDQRAITVREAARLQSFPDRFRFLGYRSRQFEHVGNAVPPLLAAAVARAIRRHLKTKVKHPPVKRHA